MGKFDKLVSGYSESEISEYFPSEHVKEATMKIYEQILGLKFKKLEKAKTYDKDVTCYEVKDAKSLEILGHFYLDLYPRDEKFGHAAVFSLLSRYNSNGKL